MQWYPPWRKWPSWLPFLICSLWSAQWGWSMHQEREMIKSWRRWKPSHDIFPTPASRSTPQLIPGCHRRESLVSPSKSSIITIYIGPLTSDYPVSSVTNSLYELKFAKIQTGYERTFCKNTCVTWVKIRALTVKYSIFQKWQELLFNNAEKVQNNFFNTLEPKWVRPTIIWLIL